MKVYRTNVNPNFKSNNIYGYDDSISKSRRDYIREHYNSYQMPYYEIHSTNGRMEDYELGKLLSGLLGQKVDKYTLKQILTKKADLVSFKEIDSNIMQKLPLYNVTHIGGTNSYRGSAPKNTGILSLMKQAGIERVVDLAGFDSIEEDCAKLGLEYLYYPIENNFFTKSAFKTRQGIESEIKKMGQLFQWSSCETNKNIAGRLKYWEKNLSDFMESFIPFIQTMQKDNVYIGCEFGTYTTDTALFMNHFFNPKAQKTPSCSTAYNKYYGKVLINLFNNLPSLYNGKYL